MTDFFIFCSGVHPSFLKRSPSEVNKYVGIGATIFFTGVLAFFSSAYAFNTVFDSLPISVFLGLIWGLMIFNLDRYIVSSIRKTSGIGSQFLMAFPRIIFALLIAIVISKPIELKLFESEINGEIVTMQEKQYKEQEDLLKARFADDEAIIISEQKEIEIKLQEGNARKDLLVNEAIAEADGTGGSQQRNLGPIYKIKKAKADQAESEYIDMLTASAPILEEKTMALQALRKERKEAIISQEKVALNGFASRLKAMSNLSRTHSEIFIASLFITFLFIALETAPIFVKLISGRGPLDYVQNKHESAYVFSHDILLDKQAQSKKYSERTLNFATNKIIEKENILVEDVINQEVEKVRNTSLDFLSIENWRRQISQFFS